MTHPDRQHQALAQLDPRATFETLVAFPGNELARKAAAAVADKPAELYNPLLLCGPAGSGKTHLLHAIGRLVLDRNPERIVLYVTGEAFANDYLFAVRHERMPAFRERYRTVEVLLLDELDSVRGKQKTQEELARTLEVLSRQGVQVVATSTRLPGELELREDLRALVSSGLLADLEPLPGAVLVDLLLREAPEAPRQVLEHLVGQARSADPRVLRGLLQQTLAAASLSGEPVDLRHVEQALARAAHRRRPPDLLALVAGRYRLRVDQLTGKSRRPHVVRARQVAAYLLVHQLGLSQDEAGEVLGLNHTSIGRACQRLEEALAGDPELLEELEALVRRL